MPGTVGSSAARRKGAGLSARRRLDAELVRRGLAPSRTEAQRAIAEGRVTIDRAPAFKASTQVAATQALAVAGPPSRYVSRGGEKLAHGLDRFDVDPAARRCLDAGASTGGFTDALLQHGAHHVIAVDVGYGQLHARLRADDRVTLLERTNVRHLTPELLPDELPDLVVADLSFISLAKVLGALRRCATPDAEAVVLVKPQFEASRSEVRRGGLVRDPAVWTAALLRVADTAVEVGWTGFGATASPLTGPAGNVEFLVHLTPGPPCTDRDAVVAAAVAEGERVAGTTTLQADATEEHPRGDRRLA